MLKKEKVEFGVGNARLIEDIERREKALEEEQTTKESIEESHNEIIAKLIKERDNANAKYKVLKKEKVEFGVGNARLIEDIESRDKAHKALESEHSVLIKSHDQLQTDRKSVV